MRPLAIALAENLVRLQKAMSTLNATVEEIASPGLADDEPTATPTASSAEPLYRLHARRTIRPYIARRNPAALRNGSA